MVVVVTMNKIPVMSRNCDRSIKPRTSRLVNTT